MFSKEKKEVKRPGAVANVNHLFKRLDDQHPVNQNDPAATAVRIKKTIPGESRFDPLSGLPKRDWSDAIPVKSVLAPAMNSGSITPKFLKSVPVERKIQIMRLEPRKSKKTVDEAYEDFEERWVEKEETIMIPQVVKKRVKEIVPVQKTRKVEKEVTEYVEVPTFRTIRLVEDQLVSADADPPQSKRELTSGAAPGSSFSAWEQNIPRAASSSAPAPVANLSIKAWENTGTGKISSANQQSRRSDSNMSERSDSTHSSFSSLIGGKSVKVAATAKSRLSAAAPATPQRRVGGDFTERPDSSRSSSYASVDERTKTISSTPWATDDDMKKREIAIARQRQPSLQLSVPYALAADSKGPGVSGADTTRGSLGVELSKQGIDLVVMGVHDNSAADIAGICPGFRIVSVDGKPVKDAKLFRAHVIEAAKKSALPFESRQLAPPDSTSVKIGYRAPGSSVIAFATAHFLLRDVLQSNRKN